MWSKGKLKLPHKQVDQQRHTFFKIQYTLSRIAVFIAAPLFALAIMVCGYKIEDLYKIRKTVERCFEKHEGPWLICSNHLTMIDSLMIAHVMFPFYKFITRYSRMPWNIPDRVNLHQVHPAVELVCFFLKCIPVVRGGSREGLKNTIARCNHILSIGENLIIFPEGKRSINGQIDTGNFPYSVGRFVQVIPNCRVMCIYLRGYHQDLSGDMPKFKETFYAAVENIKPDTTLLGLKAQRALSQQIIEKLSSMEKTYFDIRGQRHC